MKNLHLGLSLPKNVFTENLDVNSFPLTRRLLLNPIAHINPEILTIFKEAKLRIGLAELFYSPPNMISGIHRDTPGKDISKINWVYQGKNSVMSWYNTDNNKTVSGKQTNKYKYYEPDECELICKSSIHSPSLIQAAVAHNIHNFDEPRWAVSLMLYENNSYIQCPYDEAAVRLSKFII